MWEEIWNEFRHEPLVVKLIFVSFFTIIFDKEIVFLVPNYEVSIMFLIALDFKNISKTIKPFIILLIINDGFILNNCIHKFINHSMTFCSTGTCIKTLCYDFILLNRLFDFIASHHSLSLHSAIMQITAIWNRRGIVKIVWLLQNSRWRKIERFWFSVWARTLLWSWNRAYFNSLLHWDLISETYFMSLTFFDNCNTISIMADKHKIIGMRNSEHLVEIIWLSSSRVWHKGSSWNLRFLCCLRNLFWWTRWI